MARGPVFSRLAGEKTSGSDATPYHTPVTTTKHDNSCQILFKTGRVPEEDGASTGLSSLIRFFFGFSGRGQDAGHVSHADEFGFIDQHEDLVVVAA